MFRPSDRPPPEGDNLWIWFGDLRGWTFEEAGGRVKLLESINRSICAAYRGLVGLGKRWPEKKGGHEGTTKGLVGPRKTMPESTDRRMKLNQPRRVRQQPLSMPIL